MAQAAIRPEDVVVGLLAEVRQIAGERFEADPVSVHPRFFEWRDNPKFAALFDNFVFDTRDYFPFSQTLESIFDGLQFAGYLERTNPRGTWYQITPALESLFNAGIKNRFEARELDTLKTLAQEFATSIKTDPRHVAVR